MEALTLKEIIGGLVVTIVAAASVPSAIFAYYLRRIERRRERREAARHDYELYQVKMLTATAAVCEANAIALQNGKCNGETHKALAYLKEVKHAQRDFLAAQGIDNLF